MNLPRKPDFRSLRFNIAIVAVCLLLSWCVLFAYSGEQSIDGVRVTPTLFWGLLGASSIAFSFGLLMLLGRALIPNEDESDDFYDVVTFLFTLVPLGLLATCMISC